MACKLAFIKRQMAYCILSVFLFPIALYHLFDLFVSGMELARSYTVVLPSLRASGQDVHVEQGSVFYLMIKIYPDGALTPWLGALSVGELSIL